MVFLLKSSLLDTRAEMYLRLSEDFLVLGPPVVGGRREGSGFPRMNAGLAHGLFYFETGSSHVAQDNLKLTRMTLNF